LCTYHHKFTRKINSRQRKVTLATSGRVRSHVDHRWPVLHVGQRIRIKQPGDHVVGEANAPVLRGKTKVLARVDLLGKLPQMLETLVALRVLPPRRLVPHVLAGQAVARGHASLAWLAQPNDWHQRATLLVGAVHQTHEKRF
jgi:hypothetical protein